MKRLARLEHDPLLADPEIAALVAEARRDLSAMTRTATRVAQLAVGQPVEDDDYEEEEEEVETCDDCGLPADDCECARCRECGETIANCECSRCSECDELYDDCECERCRRCDLLVEDCDCDRCSHCNELEDDCECPRCSNCGDHVEDCECERCPNCGEIIADDEATCECGYVDPYQLRRIQRAMILGLNVFAKVDRNYAPVADAMAHYLSGKGGVRKMNPSCLSPAMRQRMIAKALMKDDWLNVLNAGSPEPASVLWQYDDYEKLVPEHKQDEFNKENARNADPLRYIVGGFTYHLSPRPIRGGGLAIDLHLEDVYDFGTKKDDASTTYNLGQMGLNQRIIDIALKLAKRFVGDLITIKDQDTVEVKDSTFNALAAGGFAQPFTSVVDATLMTLPANCGPVGDALARACITDFGEFSDQLDDHGVQLMIETRPEDVEKVHPRLMAANPRLSLPTLIRVLQMRNVRDDIPLVLQSVEERPDAQVAMDTLLPMFDAVHPDAVRQFIASAIQNQKYYTEPTARMRLLHETLAKFPHLDPRLPGIPPPGTPEAASAPERRIETKPENVDVWGKPKPSPAIQFPTGEFDKLASRLLRLATRIDRDHPELADRLTALVEATP